MPMPCDFDSRPDRDYDDSDWPTTLLLPEEPEKALADYTKGPKPAAELRRLEDLCEYYKRENDRLQGDKENLAAALESSQQQYKNCSRHSEGLEKELSDLKAIRDSGLWRRLKYLIKGNT